MDRRDGRRSTVDGVTVPVGGDAIVAIDGTAIRTPADVAAAIAAHRPGDRLRLAVLRHGTTRDIEVTLGNAPSGA